MRVAFVTPYDARDVTRMSGTGFHISHSFEAAGLDLEYIGPLKRQLAPLNVARYLWHSKIRRVGDHPQRDPGFLRSYARQVEQRLASLERIEHRPVDVVFGSGSLPLSYLECDLPIVFWTDCTFANLLDYYGKYTGLSARTVRNGHAMDRALYQRVTRAIFASSWARDSAVEDYGLDPERAAIVSRGANVPGAVDEAEIDRFVDARPTDRCVLLLIGVDWVRKGGDIAVECVRELRRRGIDAELRVMGCEPQTRPDDPADLVVPLGRIAKSTPEGLEQFVAELSAAHFLIVPTRAEAYGIVYLEASAYGVPSLATRTGGTGSAVNEGVTGHLFDPDAGGAAYADAAERLFRDRDAYRALARCAFADHRARTNWPVVARQAIDVLESARDEGPRRR